MKWDEARILVFLEDSEEKDPPLVYCANALKRRYAIPDAKCFRFSEGHLPGFVFPNATSLSTMTSASKLFLIGHGRPNAFSGVRATKLVEYLECFGLNQVGLIAFKACQLGAGTYMEEFVAVATGRIEVGWCIGPKHTVSMVGTHDYAEWESNWSSMIPGVFRQWFKPADELRVKIVRGNSSVLPPRGSSTRYGAPAQG